MIQPEKFVFEDDGMFPNSVLPVLVYREVTDFAVVDPAAFLEERFAANDWTNSWRNGVYPFAHYHSTSHEVLGVFSGQARLRLGGNKIGRTIEVRRGDVIVIPAGVAHQKLEADSKFGVVGAYPGGRNWDVLRGDPDERPRAESNIANLPLPENDPLFGGEGPLKDWWRGDVRGQRSEVRGQKSEVRSQKSEDR